MSALTGNDRTEQAWTRVHELLDRREDPLDDATVRNALAADPALAAEVLSLCDSLDLMTDAPAPVVRFPMAMPALLVASLAMFCFWVMNASDTDVVQAPTHVSQVPGEVIAPTRLHEPMPAILTYELTLTETHGLEVRGRTLRGDGASVTIEQLHRAGDHMSRLTETHWTESNSRIERK